MLNIVSDEKMEMMEKAEEKKEVPIWRKTTLTVDEAALYTGIGKNKLRELLDDPLCSFVLYIGRKKLIKRVEFEKFISNSIEL